MISIDSSQARTVPSRNTSRHCMLTVLASVVQHDCYMPVHFSTVPYTSSSTVPFTVVSPCGLPLLPHAESQHHVHARIRRPSPSMQDCYSKPR